MAKYLKLISLLISMVYAFSGAMAIGAGLQIRGLKQSKIAAQATNRRNGGSNRSGSPTRGESLGRTYSTGRSQGSTHSQSTGLSQGTEIPIRRQRADSLESGSVSTMFHSASSGSVSSMMSPSRQGPTHRRRISSISSGINNLSFSPNAQELNRAPSVGESIGQRTHQRNNPSNPTSPDGANHGQRQAITTAPPPHVAATEARDRRLHPATVQATLQNQGIMHVYKGGSEVPSETHFNPGKTPLYKEFTDPNKVRVSMTPMQGGEHQASGTGRHVWGTVEAGKDSHGVTQSWSYAAGKKVKKTNPDVPIIEGKAKSGSASRPVGVSSDLHGNGVLVMEASNSPSTSPPDSPGKQLPQLEWITSGRRPGQFMKRSSSMSPGGLTNEYRSIAL